MNFLLTVCIKGEECIPEPGIIEMFWAILLPVVAVFIAIHFSGKRQDKKEKNIEHWKQIGVNKPRRDFEG